MYQSSVPVAPMRPPPEAPHNANLPAFRPAPLEEAQVRRLVEQGYTRGLTHALQESKDEFALRMWVVDNSGSMQKNDGHRILSTKNRQVRFVECSRWEEIKETIEYHINLADALQAPTTFRLLNPSGPGTGHFSVGLERSGRDAHEALSHIRKVRPGGSTPLTRHILDIHAEVEGMEGQLLRDGRRVAVIIATDGLPSDEQGYSGQEHTDEFVAALRRLEGLPIWLVIRLCTDEDEVVEFYNHLDEQVELSMEVLDDYCGEAKEVYSQNPWMNYALPLHRIREFGCPALDAIDERALTKSELREYGIMLLGVDNFDGVPDPSIDETSFMDDVKRIQGREEQQWDPIKKKMSPWIDLAAMKKKYFKKGWFGWR